MDEGFPENGKLNNEISSALPGEAHTASLRIVSEPVKDRSHWPQAKLASFDEVRAYRIKQWQEAGCAARLTAAWELVTDYWVGMKGKHPDELRLQRSVAHLRRTEG
ncbi:MAG: hypothetical protein H7A50_08940 [Akkermansiaceae bacterium]|nr:hypothetical protein [Akkermansiaceae bacterium]